MLVLYYRYLRRRTWVPWCWRSIECCCKPRRSRLLGSKCWNMETIMFFINMVIRIIIMEFVVIEKIITEIMKIIEIRIKNTFFKEDENLAMKRSLLSRLAECASRQVFFLMNLVDNWCWGIICQCWALVDNWCRWIIVEHLIIYAFLPKVRPFSAMI